MKKVSIALLPLKIAVVIIACVTFYFVSSPYPICWEATDVPPEMNKVESSDTVVKNSDGSVCIKTTLFKNFMCADDPWKTPWWSVQLGKPPLNFCIARTSTYMAIFTQLCLICFVQSIHVFLLAKRSFSNYDPLDMIPAFFSVSALSSVLIIQYVLASNWRDIWIANGSSVPSSPLPHTILVCILSVGIAASIIDWIICHWLYNSEQDEIEERVKAAHLAGGSGSEHEHDE